MQNKKDRSYNSLHEVKKIAHHLEFFIDRSAETIERALSVVQQLQREMDHLKEGLSKIETSQCVFQKNVYNPPNSAPKVDD